MPYEPYPSNQPYPPSYPPAYVPPSQPPYPPPGSPPYSPMAQPPVYYNPQMAPMPVSTSGWAIASLICSLVGVQLLGIIFGFIALNEIKNSAGRIEGEGLAKAGIIIGFVFIGLGLLIVIVWFVVVGGLLLTAPSTAPNSFLGFLGLV